ncbi:thiolase-like protein [Daldinia bambusicola]|nr:thiolase-like protein [Daldinia bambusicola]
MLSNCVSYFFDWRGASVTLDTACSSSLVALHLAAQQLRLGLSRVAVVAGSNLIFDAGTFVAETNLQMLSPEGRSRMWDADANGYARGEGVAAVVLKTRKAAEADRDHIEYIIRETGKRPDRLCTPSAYAQAQLIQDYYQRAGLDLANPMHRPQYFEAHGTGTPAGDPIEAEAIISAFFSDSNSERVLAPNSDGENGSPNPLFRGIAGVLKASLAIQNAMIPPNLLFNRLNPDIEPFYGNLCVPTSLMPWPAVVEGTSVSAGTNAHAILESYEPPARLVQQPTSPIFMPSVFSAASEASLKSYLEEFYRHLRENENACDMRDMTFTLATRRTRLPVATSIGASTCRELREKLEEKLKAIGDNPEQRVGVRVPRQTGDSETPRVLGVFTGQGAQWAQMDLLRAAGIKFTAVVGHSSGEIAAAYAAGLIPAGDAICIAYYRDLYSGLARGSDGQKGAMMAVRTSADDAQDLLSFLEFEGRGCVAAVNSATSITLLGDQDAIKELEIIFRDEKKPTKILRLDPRTG